MNNADIEAKTPKLGMILNCNCHGRESSGLHVLKVPSRSEPFDGVHAKSCLRGHHYGKREEDS